MTYKDAIVERIQQNKKDGEFGTIETLEELDSRDAAVAASSSQASHRFVPTNELLHDIFGDYICHVASDMCEHWQPFGFFDKGCTMQTTMNILDIVKDIGSVRVTSDDDEESLTDEEF